MINQATLYHHIVVPRAGPYFDTRTIGERLQSTHAPPGTVLVEQHPNTPKHCPVATVTKGLSIGCVWKLKNINRCVCVCVFVPPSIENVLV